VGPESGPLGPTPWTRACLYDVIVATFQLVSLQNYGDAHYYLRRRKVMFLPLFVCLSVRKIYSKRYERILIKFFEEA